MAIDPIHRYVLSGAYVPCWYTVSADPLVRNSYQRMPTELPAPVTTLITSSGIPARVAACANINEVRGVISEGLRMTLLPAARAGMQSPKELVSG